MRLDLLRSRRSKKEVKGVDMFSFEHDWMSNDTPVAHGQSCSCDSVQHKSEQTALTGPQNSFPSAAPFTAFSAALM